MAGQMDMANLVDGCMLLKVNAGGKAVKKFVHLTPDAQYIKWNPSKKTGDPDFVQISNIHALHIGLSGPRLGRFSTQMESNIVNNYMESRADYPLDDCCGFLDKFGGANGGRKGWQKRWFVLQNSLLFYFTQPNEPTPRGGLNLAGAVVGTVPDNGVGLVLTWNDGQPDRELRANSMEERDRWIFMIRKALRLDRLRAGRRPQGALGNQNRNNNANAPVPVQEIAPPLILGLPTVPSICLSFELINTPNAIKNKGPAAFVCGSLLMLERLYSGLYNAIKETQHLDNTQYLQRINDSLQFDPHNFAARTLLALIQEENHDYDEALNSVEQVLDVVPGYASACKLAGRLYVNHKKDYNKALPYLQSAVFLTNYQDIDSLLLLGKTFVQLKDNRLAVGCFETILSLDPKNAEAHVLLGSVQLQDNNVDECINHLRIALKIDNNVANAHNILAEALYKANKFEEAATEYKDIFHNDATNVSIADKYGDILIKLERYAAAIEPLTVSLGANPNSDELSLALARAYYRTEIDRYPPPNAKTAAAASSNSNVTSSPTKDSKLDIDENEIGNEDEGNGDEGLGDDDEGEEDEIKPPVTPLPVVTAVTTPPAPTVGLGLPPPPPSGSILPPPPNGSALPPPPTTIQAPPPVTPAVAVPPPTTTSAPIAPALAPLPDPILSGVESADKLSSYELLDAADALIVNVLHRSASSPHANILCGLVYERLAELEGREVAAHKADKTARGEPLTEDDDNAGSGWSVEARLDTAKRSFSYVSAAYKAAEFAVAPFSIRTYGQSSW